MKKILAKIILGLIIVFFGFVAFVQIKFELDSKKVYASAPFKIKDLVAAADVALGKRLFTVRNGCIDCHGADLSGTSVMENGPMGSIYGTNLTPFRLAQWSDEEIANAIRYGIHKSGRSLRFMPSFDYEGLSLGDVAAMVAYIRSVPAVEKPLHENSFGFLAKFLSTAGQMPVMFPAKVLDLQKTFAVKPPEEESLEFGKYLANSCVGCHGTDLRGGKIPGGDPSWPLATNIRLGANSFWTESTFKETILSGVSLTTKEKLRPPMPVGLLAQMNELEIKVLWKYLSSLN